MKANQRWITLATLAGALATGTAAAGDWSFDATPYLWVAGLDLATSRPPSEPAGVDRFDTRISAGAMFAGEVRYRSVGLFVDCAWLRLNTAAIRPGPLFSYVNLKSDFIHTTCALTYRLPLEGKLQVEALAGARIWYVGNEFSSGAGAIPGVAAATDQAWADPLVGAEVRYDLTRRWSLDVKGTVGGFGVGATIAWEAFGGVSYRFTDWCSATLGYRYLHENYSRDRSTFNLDAHGFLLGMGFHF